MSWLLKLNRLSNRCLVPRAIKAEFVSLKFIICMFALFSLFSENAVFRQDICEEEVEGHLIIGCLLQ